MGSGDQKDGDYDAAAEYHEPKDGDGVAWRTADAYAEVATMHGVYYIFETKYGRLSSAFWAVICIVLIGLGIYATVTVREGGSGGRTGK